MEGSHGRHGSVDKSGLPAQQLRHVPAAGGRTGYSGDRLPDLPAVAAGAENQFLPAHQGCAGVYHRPVAVGGQAAGAELRAE